MTTTLSTEERLERIERAIVELDARSQTSGSRVFGWNPEDRPNLNSLMQEAIDNGTKPVGR